MPVKQGDLGLLQHPAAVELLQSKIPARLAYVWMDGTPRVVPIWFHWNGREFVMASSPKAPKLKALAMNSKVAFTIDDNSFPHKVLLVRGTAHLNTVEGVVPEYASAASATLDANRGKPGSNSWVVRFRAWCASRLHRNGLGYWISKRVFQVLCPPDPTQNAVCQG
jgi:hypothetical protein